MSADALHSPDGLRRGDAFEVLLARLGDHWGWVLGYGLATSALGVLMLAWPDATLIVAAALFAVQLLATGVFSIVGAFAADATGGQRALLGILGALSVLVGLLCLRSPLHTLVAIALLVGAWWLVSGIIELISAVSAGPVSGRGWRLAMGGLSVVAGIYVLLRPGISLVTLVIVVGIWLILYGVLAVAAAFTVRSAVHAKTSGTTFPSHEVRRSDPA